MVTPAMAVLVEGRRRGIAFTIDEDGHVRYQGPAGAMTPELMADLRAHPDEISRLLKVGHDRAVVGLLARFTSATIAAEFPLIAPVAHRWGLCSECGMGSCISLSSTPPCRLTPGCPGRHGATQGTRNKERVEKDPDRKKLRLPARRGDVVHLVRCDVRDQHGRKTHNGVLTKMPCPRCHVFRTVELGAHGALPSPDSSP